MLHNKALKNGAISQTMYSTLLFNRNSNKNEITRNKYFFIFTSFKNQNIFLPHKKGGEELFSFPFRVKRRHRADGFQSHGTQGSLHFKEIGRVVFF